MRGLDDLAQALALGVHKFHKLRARAAHRFNAQSLEFFDRGRPVMTLSTATVILSITATGVPAGEWIPAQWAICTSAKPCSTAVESGGKAEMRGVQVFDVPSAAERAVKSFAPRAANGTTRRIGLLGQLPCANVGVLHSAYAVKTARAA